MSQLALLVNLLQLAVKDRSQLALLSAATFGTLTYEFSGALEGADGAAEAVAQ